MIGNGHRRRLRAPEVLQQSETDCGPAALASLAGGFGVPLHLPRLRELCRTSVDGTSIDVLEEVAQQLGLDAEQVMVPVEHLDHDASRLLPALAVTVLPDGLTHFVVVWRRIGRWFEVLDPAIGRRFPTVRRFTRELYQHRQQVPAAGWLSWASSDEAVAVLRRRLTRLGVAPTRTEAWIDGARAADSVQPLANLEAAVRFEEALATEAGSDDARRVERRLARLLDETPAAQSEQLLAPLRTIAPLDVAGEHELTGIVLVTVRGRLESPAPGALDMRDLDSVREPEPKPLRMALGALAAARDRVVAAAASAGLAAAGLVAEGLLLAAVIGGAGQPASLWGRIEPFAALIALAGALVVLALVRSRLELQLGRHLETRLRVALFEKLPRLPDRFVASRLPADLVERAHAVALLRELPRTFVGLISAASRIAVLLVALALLFPHAAPLAALAGALAGALAWAARERLTEASLRTRALAAVAGRALFDALRGLYAVRSHAAEEIVEAGHRRALAAWRGAARKELFLAGAMDLAAAAPAYALAALAVLYQASDGGFANAPAVLLVAWWVLQLPELASEMVGLAFALERQRAVAARLLEPLAADEEGAVDEALPATAGMALHFDRVGLDLGGRAVLSDVDLEVRAGERLALVGRSGAGKSSLLGLVLGWHAPSRGTLSVDGSRLSPARRAAIRAQILWIDPGVTLWDRSLLANVEYGSTTNGDAGERIELAGLTPLLADLEDGSATLLGEAGGLVSGGEGQRVRVARALGCADPRLVLLDEPFRGLDRAARRILFTRLLERIGGATVICALHDPEDLEHFDRAARIDEGRVVALAPAADLAASMPTRSRARRGWQRVRLAGGRIEEVAR